MKTIYKISANNIFIITIILLGLFSSCSKVKKDSVTYETEKNNVPEITYDKNLNSINNANSGNEKLIYDLNIPNNQFALPVELKEVSGVVYLSSNNLACVQDEKAEIFIYSLKEKCISEIYSFGNEGDFEGITFVKGVFYIIRSDGILFEIVKHKSGVKLQNKYNLNIPEADFEGICFNEQSNNLMLVSKEKTKGEDKDKKNSRYIYGFDLENKSLCEEPLFIISLEAINDFLFQNNIPFSTKNKKEGDKKKLKTRFKASDISIHPKTEDIFVLSAEEYLLYIFDRKGKIKNIEILDEKLYPQAEGITFNNSGDMYITTEGKDMQPTLYFLKNAGH